MAIGNNRIIVLIDMDCFFCQVETRLRPDYKGKPLAVVQYNQWQLGGIIAVNYEARAFGVTRHMRGKEAKEKCPDLILASVPCLREKSDTSRYRSAGREVIDVISQRCNVIERASVDEAYLDMTDLVDKKMASVTIHPRELASCLSNTYVVGYSDIGKNDEEDRKEGIDNWIQSIFQELADTHAQKLAVAGILVEELRADIFEKTGFRCSAGISQNKILAKLACGLHKPNRQTILPPAAVSSLYSTLPIKRVRNLGGKFGDVIVESLKCNVMGDLLQYSLRYLQKRFDEKTGLWLYNIARGIDNEPVTTRLVSKSIGACKKFPGKQAIVSLDVLRHWVGELAAEVCDRLEQDLQENQRRATLLTVCYHYYKNRSTISQSRSCALKSYNPEKMADECVNIVTKSTQCRPVAYLGISAGKFVVAKDGGSIRDFFKTIESRPQLEISNGPEANGAYIDSGICRAEGIVARNKIDSSEEFDPTDICKNNDKKDDAIKNNAVGSTKDSAKGHRAYNKSEYGKRTNVPESASLDESPVSIKVNKLIQMCNERSGETSSGVKLFNGVIKGNMSNRDGDNGCEIESQTINFERSFFLNVFKDRQNRNEGRISASEREAKALDNMEDFYCNDEYQEGHHSWVQRERNNAEEEFNRPRADSNAIANTCAVKLQEIFPDLNDIDPSIITLLPLELQEEASLYLKQNNKRDKRLENVGSDVKFVDSSRKTAKAKVSKSKNNSSKNAKNSLIYGFLVKTNKGNGNSDEPVKRCPQCGQMISIAKYGEHYDFHIAQNLQEELNKHRMSGESTKRKNNSSPTENTATKRRSCRDITKYEKNGQSITTFFS